MKHFCNGCLVQGSYELLPRWIWHCRKLNRGHLPPTDWSRSTHVTINLGCAPPRLFWLRYLRPQHLAHVFEQTKYHHNIENSKWKRMPSQGTLLSRWCVFSLYSQQPCLDAKTRVPLRMANNGWAPHTSFRKRCRCRSARCRPARGVFARWRPGPTNQWTQTSNTDSAGHQASILGWTSLGPNFYMQVAIGECSAHRNLSVVCCTTFVPGSFGAWRLPFADRHMPSKIWPIWMQWMPALSYHSPLPKHAFELWPVPVVKQFTWMHRWLHPIQRGVVYACGFVLRSISCSHAMSPISTQKLRN